MGLTRGLNPGLKRVAQVYALLERIRSAELSVASGAVREVEEARDFQSVAGAQQAGAERAALILGNRADWTVAEAERAASKVRTERLEELRLEREAVRQTAMEAYRQSRLELRQMQYALDKQRRQLQLDAARQAQAAADDRYLSRREWLRAQVEDGSFEA